MMTGLVSLIVTLSSLLSGIASAQQQSCSNNLSVTYPAPVAASGWQFRLIANGFTRPRGIAFDGDGGLLVVESGAGVTHLTLDDEGGTCLTVRSKKRLIADENVSFLYEL
jgi:glucose/arabinose dehydrogenase